MRHNLDTSRILRVFNARLAYHIYFWTFLFIGWILFNRTDKNPLLFTVLYSMSITVMALFPVYLHFFIFKQYFSKKRYCVYTILLLTIIIVFGILYQAFFSKAFDDPNGVINFMFNISFLIIITTALKFVKHGIRQRLLFQEIKAKQLQTELDLLKAQINPHFLFNTLNNLYGIVSRENETAAKGIARLSDLMRYMIHESNSEEIDLEKEVHQLHQLIELQKLRFSEEDDISIEFRIEGDMKGIQIPPMLLIPFVENAFKHGINFKASSFIKIFLKMTNNSIHFSVKNSVHTRNEKDEEALTGLGLHNVKRRLELLYPDAHDLKILNFKNVFEIQLIINL
jgi:two-component system LytT family sensor kinase